MPSVQVLDPQGRELRSLPPRKAAEKVRRGDARWIAHPEATPHTTAGTIQLLHEITLPPPDSAASLVLAPNGEQFGRIRAELAADYLRHGLVSRIGFDGPLGPRAVMANPEYVQTGAVWMVMCWEGERAGEATWNRDALREEIVALVAGGCPWEDVGRFVANRAGQLVGPREQALLMRDVRALSRQLGAVEFLDAKDFAKVRKRLIETAAPTTETTRGSAGGSPIRRPLGV